MKRILSAIAVVTLLVFPAAAKTISPDEALRRVASEGRPSKVAAMHDKNLQLMEVRNAGDEPAVYVFGNTVKTPCFLVASADDDFPALLGYGDNAAGSNPAFDYWIGEYARQIEWARTHGLSSPAYKAPARAEIAPMVVTKWDQASPYNDLCPIVGGQRSMTGCTATALAQVMKYYNWPPQGEGTHTTNPGGGYPSATVNFALTKYDWDNMLPQYGDNATDAQKRAVATLMLSCGVAADMSYSPEASAAWLTNAALGLSRNLRYDKGAICYQRNFYSLEEWNDLIYDQLVNYGPVEYSGSNQESGHAFVCDGYSSDGFYHINWGWGGMSDGYFLLGALDPAQQGIGGSTAGFNMYQQIIGNVKPATGSDRGSYAPYFVCDSFVINSASQGEYPRIDGFISNASLVGMTGMYGIRAESATGQIFYINGSEFSNLDPGYGFASWYIDYPSGLAPGTYKVVPVVRINGQWREVRVRTGAPTTTTITISSAGLLAASPSAAVIKATNIEFLTPFYADKKIMATLRVENISDIEYYGGVSLVLATMGGEVVSWAASYALDLVPGESAEISYEGRFPSQDASAGNYYVYFVNDSGECISDKKLITLKTVGTTKIDVSNLRMPGGTTNVDPANLYFEADVRCTSGYFDGELCVPIWHDNQMYAELYADMKPLESGQSTVAVFSGSMENPVYGATYNTMVFNREAWEYVGNYLEFTLARYSSEVDAAVTPEVVVSEWFTLSGISVDPVNLAPGLYIVRDTMTDGTVRTYKRQLAR